MKLKLDVNKSNVSEVEAYLGCIALNVITENQEIDSLFSCPTVHGYVYEMRVQNLYDVETAMLRLREYAKSIVRCKIYHDTLLSVIKAKNTRKRAELFKASVTDTYSSDTMNLTELKFYLDHFVLED